MPITYGHLSNAQLACDIFWLVLWFYALVWIGRALLRPTFGIQPRGKGK